MILESFPPSEPDDSSAILAPEILARLLEKAQRVDELTQTVELKSEVIMSLKQRIRVLEEALRLSRIKRFSPSSEQSEQTSLFDEAELESTIALEATANEKAIDDDLDAAEFDVIALAKPKQKPGRKPFASNLPREQIFITLSDEEKAGAISTFFTKAKEELDIIPAKVRILEYMQEKAVFLDTHQAEQKRRIIAATLPKHPVPG
jgi:hypothetical protein